MRIVFLGTPQIAVPSLEYLINKEDVEVLATITQPDKPAGRGKKLCTTPICCVAKEYNVPTYQPKSIRKEQDLINILKELKPDFFVTFAFGQILSQEVLNIPKYGTINLHASLLPEYRGANPIQAPIVNGNKKTGITTMLTEIGIDTGAIVLQKDIEITENMTSIELHDIIRDISPEFIYESLKGLENGTISPKQQDHEKATHAPKVKKEDGLIDWSEPAEKIHNKVRGLKPWPGAATYIKGTCIKIAETRLTHEEKINSDNYGEIIDKINSDIKVITGDGAIIITKVQPACKAEMDAASWYNGARIQKGDKFEAINMEKADTCECACDAEKDCQK